MTLIKEIMKKLMTFLILILLLSGSTFAQEKDDIAPTPSKVRWLVKFNVGTKPNEIESLASAMGAEVQDLGPYADFKLFLFDEAPGDETTSLFESTSGMVYAEQEARFVTTKNSAAFAMDDPLQRYQWAHRMINLPTAHSINFGSDPGVTVAVLDTGVAYANTANHAMAPDLAGAIIYNGYDFVSEDNLALDEGDGEVGHGTFLASVIAQATYNGRGAAGVAFNAAILPVRIANRRGIARASDLARGIKYAVANGATIIVLGVAGLTDSAAVHEAVEFAYSNGVAIIAPAGNAESVRYPAAYFQVVSVGAVDAVGRRAYYSPTEGPVDIYAPGGDLRQGVDANGDGLRDGIIAESFLGRRFDRFQTVMMEGTSAAAAHVAGAAALLISQAGPLSPDALYRALRNGTRIVNGLPLLDAGKLLLRTLDFTR